MSLCVIKKTQQKQCQQITKLPITPEIVITEKRFTSICRFLISLTFASNDGEKQDYINFQNK